MRRIRLPRDRSIHPCRPQRRLQGGKSLTTGFYQNELGVPAAALLEAGYTLTPVTPRGNRPVVDKHSVDPQYFGGNPQEMVRIGAVVEGLLGAGKVLSLREVLASGPERYAGLFIPGGHAPLIDLAKDPEVGTLLRHFHDNHKPTAAICHGPQILVTARLLRAALGLCGSGPALRAFTSLREMSLRRTKKDRPDLFARFQPQDKRDKKILDKINSDER